MTEMSAFATFFWMGDDVGVERLAAVRGLGAVIVAGESHRLTVADRLGLDVSGTQAISHLGAYGPTSHSELGRRLGPTLVEVLPRLAEGLRRETDQLRATSARRPTPRTRVLPDDA